MKPKAILRRLFPKKKEDKVLSPEQRRLQRKISDRMKIKGAFGPREEELEKELRPVHEKLIDRKVKSTFGSAFTIAPVLSLIAVKYAIMSAGNLPKHIRNKVARLFINRELFTLALFKLFKDNNIKIPIGRGIRERFDKKIRSFIGDAEKSEKIISDYDEIYGNIVLESEKIWHKRLKEGLGK